MSDPRIREAMALLPDYLSQHVLIAMTALALGVLVSLPLAVLSLRRPVLRSALLGATSTVQTIPGLALLALFYPLLLALAGLSERLLGFGFSALGFLPALLALTLYSMLPVVRNTITGIEGVAPAILEAARGVGMSRRQSLLMVELPLALPVIMAGIRTASAWVIGTATLSTPIGQTSLGNYIFTGLQTQNWVFVLFGCVCAAALALVVDRLLTLVEQGLAERRRSRLVGGAVGLATLVAIALAPSFAAPARPGYVVGAKTFSEQYILAALIERRLAARGLPASRRDGLGSAVVFKALAEGDIDVYVDYSGTLWANQMGQRSVKPRAEVLAEVARWVADRHGVRLIGGLGFENAYGLAMKAERAEALGIRTIADLARHAPTLTIAGDYEFFGRPEWAALEQAYGLAFRSRRQMQAEFMYTAAAAGEVDVISAFTSDGRIARHKLRVLADPRQALPPYDAILLVSPKRTGDAALLAALRPLVGAIDVERMRRANLKASTGETPATVARWLDGQLGR